MSVVPSIIATVTGTASNLNGLVTSSQPPRVDDVCFSPMERLVWTPREVVDVDGPRAMLRASLEQRDVRRFCANVSPAGNLSAACDVGCGFGRLTPVLTEFAERV